MLLCLSALPAFLCAWVIAAGDASDASGVSAIHYYAYYWPIATSPL